jgi:hypothetical protein
MVYWADGVDFCYLESLDIPLYAYNRTNESLISSSVSSIASTPSTPVTNPPVVEVPRQRPVLKNNYTTDVATYRPDKIAASDCHEYVFATDNSWYLYDANLREEYYKTTMIVPLKTRQRLWYKKYELIRKQTVQPCQIKALRRGESLVGTNLSYEFVQDNWDRLYADVEI